MLMTDLQRDIILFTDVSCQLNDSLHALDLTLDSFIKIVFLDFGEEQEMNRSSVSHRQIIFR